MAKHMKEPLIPKVSPGQWRIPRRYHVRSIIGSGAYGSVAEAYDSQRDCLVAVKRQRKIFHDAVSCKRMLRELAILRKLNHDNVVKLYDVIRPENTNSFDELYYIMEICDSDLRHLLKTDVRLKPIAINTLLYNLLVGLKYIHSAGIYHRDLKPANCLVNQDCSIKICDFGLSRTLDVTPEAKENAPCSVVPNTACPRRVLTGHVVTRWYRAPELILLQHSYTQAIDVWSIGCIYAELLQMLDDGPAITKRGPLFPGSSCYPLSPCHGRQRDYSYHTRGQFEQLNKIFNVLGTPDDAIEQLTTESSKRYAQLFEKRAGIGLQKMFPYVPPESLDILEQTLRFNPRDRIAVEQALDHELFSDCRQVDREITAPEHVSLAFESQVVLDEAQLRLYFAMEMNSFHGARALEHSMPESGSQTARNLGSCVDCD